MSNTGNGYDDDSEPSAMRGWVKRIVIAVVVLLVLYGLGLALKGLFSGHSPQKKPVTTIKILPDTPPPPPPPPKEPPKEQPKEQPKEIKMEQPKPQEAPQPPAEALKMEGAAGDGPSPFQAGTVTKDYEKGDVNTSAKIGGRPSNARFSWYTSNIKTQIEEMLAKDKSLSVGKYSVIIHLWLEKDGRIKRLDLAGSSGDGEIDGRIRTALASMPAMPEPPPEDMPQPVKLRVTARNSG